jgi:hypothetical protein
MGSYLEHNDTLQLTIEQGFPAHLDIHRHLITPYRLDDFKGLRFQFADKPAIRVYMVPPVRNFLVQNIDGKWIYWGHAFITSIHHDYLKQTTSGEFEIIKINTPEEMRHAFSLCDRRPEFDYFAGSPPARG